MGQLHDSWFTLKGDFDFKYLQSANYFDSCYEDFRFLYIVYALFLLLPFFFLRLDLERVCLTRYFRLMFVIWIDLSFRKCRSNFFPFFLLSSGFILKWNKNTFLPALRAKHSAFDVIPFYLANFHWLSISKQSFKDLGWRTYKCTPMYH